MKLCVGDTCQAMAKFPRRYDKFFGAGIIITRTAATYWLRCHDVIG